MKRRHLSKPVLKVGPPLAACGKGAQRGGVQPGERLGIWGELRFKPEVSPESVVLAAVRCFKHQSVRVRLSVVVVTLWQACEQRNLPCPGQMPDVLTGVLAANVWATGVVQKEDIPRQHRLAPLTMARLLHLPGVPDFEVRRRIEHLDALVRDAAPVA